MCHVWPEIFFFSLVHCISSLLFFSKRKIVPFTGRPGVLTRVLTPKPVSKLEAPMFLQSGQYLESCQLGHCCWLDDIVSTPETPMGILRTCPLASWIAVMRVCLRLCGAQASICSDWQTEEQGGRLGIAKLRTVLSLTPRVSYIEIHHLLRHFFTSRSRGHVWIQRFRLVQVSQGWQRCQSVYNSSLTSSVACPQKVLSYRRTLDLFKLSIHKPSLGSLVQPNLIVLSIYSSINQPGFSQLHASLITSQLGNFPSSPPKDHAILLNLTATTLHHIGYLLMFSRLSLPLRDQNKTFYLSELI